MRERKKLKPWQKRILSQLTTEERKRFFLLNKREQKKLIRNAQNVSSIERLRTKQQSVSKDLPLSPLESVSVVQKAGTSSAQALQYMFRQGKLPEEGEGSEENSSGGKETSPALSGDSRSLIEKGRKIISGSQKEQEQRIMGRQSVISQWKKKLFNGSGKSASKKLTRKGIGTAVKTTAKAPLPISAKLAILAVILLFFVLIIAIIVVSIFSLLTTQNTQSHQAQVSERTESYRPLVVKYCEKYEIGDYVDLALAMIEQESSGNPPDIMQSEESPYNKEPPIDSVEESLDCGCHELADCIKAAGCSGPNDMDNIKLALQSYNFGNGYLAWAKKNYGGYSKENAILFSQMMCQKLGWKRYGDVDYVPHVLRYYAVAENNIENKKANDIVKELKENNIADAKAWVMIEYGASLVGKVSYSQVNRQTDGRDDPTYLDCSSFTAWCMNKAGYTAIPYGSYTGTFLSSDKLKEIKASELQPGDLGLKNRSSAGGSSNHVGIYCGKLKNGTKVWLHCTTSSGSSLTGNRDGVMFGAYTNFTVFKRIKQ